jgi:Mg-chelatase subunit ChlD
MTFTSPLYLILALLLPVFAWIGWPASGPARGREAAALALRLALVLCLILALAGLQIVHAGNELAVVFLVDVSDSVSSQAVAVELDYVRKALAAMKPDDQAAIVLFGADALVERPMQPGSQLGSVRSVPVTNQTDLAEAIRLGLALFPSGAARRMVILSDGAQTSGDAIAAAQFASAAGVQILSVPLSMQTGTEAWLVAADAPTHLRPGEQFDLGVSIQATQPVRATLRVLAGDTIVYEAAHDLRRGLQTFSLPLSAGAPGFVRYRVQIEPEQDGFYQNNRLDAFSEVEGPPSVLVVAPPAGGSLPGGGIRPDEHSALLGVLAAAGFSADLIPPGLLPSDLTGLARYSSVILVDVPAPALSLGQMETLQSYVRDLGGGLVAIGGPTSFGVGGYYHTPLETALPVDMEIKDEQRRPSLGIVFIIDHSGSMSETSGGVTKLELAKEAAARSVELLFPGDRVGVIAFDDTASWVVPMTGLSEPEAVIEAIGSIQPGGGTDILAGLQAMAEVLPADPARVKHVILLTDGGADPAGIPELVERLHTEQGITLSAVAVGRDAAPFLEDLAALGGGRYHFAADPGSIPSIFTEETTLATRAYIVEEPFTPKLVNPSPMLAGIESLPRFYGYVASSPKDLAQVILQSGKGDPILAAWQYGLGRSVAFTSDATGRWARDWVASADFATFWAQTVRSTLGNSPDAAFELSVAMEGEQARLSLDARDRSGDFLNGYQIEANVISPDGAAQAIGLRQVGPGQYEGSFHPGEQGVYLIHLSGQGTSDGEGFSETTGWALSYSPEYRRIGGDLDLLLRLAAISGGKVAGPDPAEVFAHDLTAARASRPIWPWLVISAAVLLPFDVAVRRLILTRRDLVRLWERFLDALRMRPRLPAGTAGTTERMQALFQAKTRARGEAPPSAPLDVEGPPDEGPARAESEPEPPEAPLSAGKEQASMAASLLAQKKKSRAKRR